MTEDNKNPLFTDEEALQLFRDMGYTEVECNFRVWLSKMIAEVKDTAPIGAPIRNKMLQDLLDTGFSLSALVDCRKQERKIRELKGDTNVEE